METYSALLALGGGNPPVTGGLSSPRADNASFGAILWCKPKQTVEQKVELPLI